MSKFLKDLSLLSLPIMAGQIGIMLIGIGDVFIASKHSALSLASIGIALNVINPVMLFGIGLMFGISPYIAIKKGKGDNLEDVLKSSMMYCLLVGIVLTLISFLFIPLVGVFNFSQEMVPLIKSYIYIVIFSFPFVFIYQVLKDYLQAFEKVKYANFIAIMGAVVNIPLNYALVFGEWGAPKLGFEGMAYASVLVRLFMAIAMLLAVYKKLFSGKIDFQYITGLFKYSFPIASMFFCEVLGFCLMGIFAGKLGVSQAATNNLILNIASLTFMVPLSIASAVSVKVGTAYGEKSYDNLKKYALTSVFMSTSFMIVTASAFVLIPEQIISLFTEDLTIMNLGVQVLIVAGIFQIFDGIQVTLGGVLRGIKRTKENFIGIIVGFWLIGIPLGLFLAYEANYGLLGLWIGIAIALCIVSLVLSVLTRKNLKRLISDGV